MAQAAPPLFAFEGVSVRANGRHLLDGVDAVLPEGGVTVLIGPSASGTTIVVVLHDLNMACRYADHVIAMKDGGILAEGPRARSSMRP